MIRAIVRYDQDHVFMHTRSGSLQRKMAMLSQIEDQQSILQMRPIGFSLLAIKLWVDLPVVRNCHTYDLTHKIPMTADVILHSKN